MQPCQGWPGNFSAWPSRRSRNLWVIIPQGSKRAETACRKHCLPAPGWGRAWPKISKRKLPKLRDEIRYHEHRYYVLDDPEISDLEFDKLMQRLQDLEERNPGLVTPDSPTHRVGGAPAAEFPKVRHSAPMLSLDNTYSVDELRDFDRRVRELSGRSTVEYVGGVEARRPFHGPDVSKTAC